ncbi:hypothetical protein SETIT_2G234000v2 [Setaria italica]|uniref:Uncharacterized protein n=2 Tax=Setaria TaxID=4554 RepID=K4A1U0_SETIT|nr:hypothetical protein SETIT_2G234000v2 [Setaria italica]TKW33537.1 hypothetical protein SEVIR_2G243400v2 [Setaria viridis]
MAGLKSLCACILIFLIVSSGAASGEARRLLAETRAGAGEEAACAGGCRRPPVVQVQGRAGLAATATKMATIDGRPTAPGHSPGIGNKIAGNTR